MRDDIKTRWRHAGRNNAAWSRRQLLLSGVLGGSALLAGCIGGEDDPEDTPTDEGNGGNGGNGDTPTPEDVLPDGYVEGQTLRIPFYSNPGDVSTFWDFTDYLATPYENDLNIYRATHEAGMWGRWWDPLYVNDFGPQFPQLIESVDVGVDVVSVKIHDDAYWSDGQPVRALDALTRKAPYVTPYPANDPDPEVAYNAPPELTGITGAINRYEFPDGEDGKTWEWHLDDIPEWNEIGGFERFERSILSFIAGPDPRIGVKLPSHVEPYKTMLEVSREYWDDRDIEKPLAEEITQEYASEDDVMRLREGDEYVSNGAWTLDEIVGTTEIVLKKNEYHRYADDINFDEVILEYSPEDTRTQTALMSSELDYASLTLPPEASENLPGTYEEFTSPAAWGLTISIDHSTIFGSDPRIRQAMMYAINKPNVAQNHHPTITEAITTPGWDNWAADGALSEEWATENLISYEHDLAAAEDLMHEAGFERNSSGIWERDGDVLQSQLATQSEVPSYEETVAAQLRDFGMDITVQTFPDAATFQDRWHGSTADAPIDDEYAGSGDFALWAYGDGAAHIVGGYYNGLSNHWWNGLSNNANVRARNYFDHDKQEEALEAYLGPSDGLKWIAGLYDNWRELTVDIPPIGDPEGTPEPFNPAYTNGATSAIGGGLSPMDPQPDNPYYETPHDEPHQENGEHFWQKFAWLTNYWLPVLPLVRTQSQHFVNTTNFNWPNQLEGDDNEYMWDYFGQTYLVYDLPGMNKIVADPDNPKPGANVIGE